jgi:hypothetical protein
MRENKGILAELLRTYPKNDNLPNPRKIFNYHPKGRRDRGRPLVTG